MGSNGRTSSWWSSLARQRDDRDLAAYRRLAVQLHHDLAAGGMRRGVIVASPTDATIAARSASMLACCAAEQLGEAVLMVDACSSDPVLTAIVGADGSAGFADLGLHNVAHGDADSPGWRADVLGTSADGVSFLPAGTSRRSPRLAEIRAFLHDAERAYAMVILAGGAVLSDAAGLGMAPDAGCVLLAVVEHRTRVSDLTEAQQALTLARANRVGLLMTQRTRRRLLPGGPPTTAVVKATRPASPAPVSPIIRPTTAEQGG